MISSDLKHMWSFLAKLNGFESTLTVTLYVESVRQPWTRMLVVVYERSGHTDLVTGFWGRSFQNISGLCDAPRLLMAACRLNFSTRPRTFNADYYVTNLIPILVQDLTDARWFYLSTGWRSSSHRACDASPVTRQLLWLRCSWTSKPSTNEELRTRLEMIWNDRWKFLLQNLRL